MAERVDSWAIHPVQSWANWCQDIAAFISCFQRLPRRSDQAKDENAKFKWLERQRKQVTMLSPDQIGQLSKASPLMAERIQKWIDPLFNWRRTFGKFSEFVKLNARIPSKHKDDASARVLESWMRNQARDIKILRDEQLELLRNVHPMMRQKIEEWLHSARNNMVIYEKRCQDLTDFLEHHDRIPKHCASFSNERPLAVWLSQQLKSVRKLSPEQLDMIRATHPKVASLVQERSDPLLKWQAQCYAVKAFVDANGRCAYTEAVDPHERQLGRWLFYQSRCCRAGKLTNEAVEFLRSCHPIIAERVDRWQDPQSLWRGRIRELSAFLREFARSPRISARDRNEKSLSLWIASQSQEFKAGNLSPEQIEEFKNIHELIAARVDKWQVPASTPLG
ncbi:unnamed protein product [Polarella glacialis]|uniref:Helicase-associated domain-containing protein n=1 Tax=Polarella glacialis TaxID=89957 RepID=A0A813D6C4_POLGL|nr:unnamed protein product [Polarella glacialis]